MNGVRSLSCLRGLLSIFLLVCGQFGVRAVAQAVAGTVQLQGKVVVAQGSIVAVMTDSDSRNFPHKLYKIIVNANTKVLEVGGTDGYIKPISISDIKVGDHVMMLGRLASLTATDYVATSVTRTANAGNKVAGAAAASPSLAVAGNVAQSASPTMPPQSGSSQGPARSRVGMLVGRVQSISGNTLSVQTSDNNNVAARNQLIQINIDSHTRVVESAYRDGEYSADTVKPIPSTSIAIGDDLTVFGQFDTAGSRFSASGVSRKVLLSSATSAPRAQVSTSATSNTAAAQSVPVIAARDIHQMQGPNDLPPYHWQITEYTDPLTNETTRGVRQRIRFSPTSEFVVAMGCKEDLGMALVVKSLEKNRQLSHSCKESRLLAGDKLFQGDTLDCTRYEDDSIGFGFVGSFSHVSRIQAHQTAEVMKAAAPPGPDKEKQNAIADMVGMFLEGFGNSTLQGMPAGMSVLGIPQMSDLIQASTVKVEIPLSDGGTQILTFSPQDPVVRAYTATCVDSSQ
jgi:hypothetical protein